MDYQSFGSQSHDQEDHLLNRPNQNLDVDPNLLSGDEAMEKSFSVNSFSMAGKHGKTNMVQTSIVISKSILGVGILGLPNVTSKFGLIPTITLLLLFYLQTQYCSNLYLKCKNLSGRSNISTIGFDAFKSKKIISFISFIIFINNLGLCFAEMTIQTTTIKKLTTYFYGNDLNWYQSYKLLSPLTALIMAPLMVIKKIEKLKNVGLLALLAMFVFTAAIISTVIINKEVSEGFALFNPDFSIIDAFAVFPTLLLAFSWQFNLFPVYKGMIKPTDKKLINVSFIGMGISTLFYLTVGILGYVIYGKNTEANFLSMTSPEIMGEVQFIVLNATFYLSTVLTTPLVFYGAKNNFLSLVQPKKKNNTVQVNDSEYNDKVVKLVEDKKKRKRRKAINYYCYSLGLFTIIVIGAITIDSLEVAFNIIGAISSNSIGCVLSSLFYFKLVKQKYQGFKLTAFEKFQYYFAVTFFVYSIFMSILCVSSEVSNIVKGHKGD